MTEQLPLYPDTLERADAQELAIAAGILACAVASSTAKDALGFFHPADVVEPLSAILERPNVTIATFQKHINEFCEEARGRVLERVGEKRAYKYRFRDPLLPSYVFMSALADGSIDGDRLRSLTF